MFSNLTVHLIGYAIPILHFATGAAFAEILVFDDQAEFEAAVSQTSNLVAIEGFDSGLNTLMNLPDLPSEQLLPGVPLLDSNGFGFPNGLQDSQDIGVGVFPIGNLEVYGGPMGSQVIGPDSAADCIVVEVISENVLNIGFNLYAPFSNTNGYEVLVLSPNNDLLLFELDHRTGTNGTDGFFGIIATEGETINDIMVVNNNSFFPDTAIDDVQLWERAVKGDVNQDGAINLLDVDPFVDLLGNGAYQLEADINCDGSVNLLDVDGFIGLLG